MYSLDILDKCRSGVHSFVDLSSETKEGKDVIRIDEILWCRHCGYLLVTDILKEDGEVVYSKTAIDLNTTIFRHHRGEYE